MKCWRRPAADGGGGGGGGGETHRSSVTTGMERERKKWEKNNFPMAKWKMKVARRPLIGGK